MVPAVAWNVAVVLPDATVTEAGTVSDATLADSATVTPPLPDTVTVQVDEPPELRDAGAQLSAVGVGDEAATTVTVPPTPFAGRPAPAAVTPNVLVGLMVALDTPEASVTLTRATTPFWIGVLFMPVSRQT